MKIENSWCVISSDDREFDRLRERERQREREQERQREREQERQRERTHEKQYELEQERERERDSGKYQTYENLIEQNSPKRMYTDISIEVYGQIEN